MSKNPYKELYEKALTLNKGYLELLQAYRELLKLYQEKLTRPPDLFTKVQIEEVRQ